MNETGEFEVPDVGPTRLANTTCPFCGIDLASVHAIKEHLIARRFVPKGTMNNQWNLIANACEVCNSIKGDLEDEISAVTMERDTAGRLPENDARLKRDSHRKGKGARNRSTGRIVAKSRLTGLPSKGWIS